VEAPVADITIVGAGLLGARHLDRAADDVLRSARVVFATRNRALLRFRAGLDERAMSTHAIAASPTPAILSSSGRPGSGRAVEDFGSRQPLLRHGLWSLKAYRAGAFRVCVLPGKASDRRLERHDVTRFTR